MLLGMLSTPLLKIFIAVTSKKPISRIISNVHLSPTKSEAVATEQGLRLATEL